MSLVHSMNVSYNISEWLHYINLASTEIIALRGYVVLRTQLSINPPHAIVVINLHTDMWVTTFTRKSHVPAQDAMT